MSRTRKRPSFPKPWHHKASGRAVVTLRAGSRRQDVWLGPWGSPEAAAAYRRLVAAHEQGTALAAASRCIADLTVAELLEAWLEASQARPRRSNEIDNYKPLIALLLELYGPTPAAAFGPKDFRLVRDELLRRGRARTGINRTMVRLRTLWRWAAAQELVPVERVHAMEMVRGLRAGESSAREPEPVVAVPWEDVEPVLPMFSSVVRAMVLVGWHTGARPGEVCKLRPCDIAFDGPNGTWVATIADHKT
ncbi:MAG: hypothetical protein KDA22_04465, partial [Phycisphaerales bacterium]|nr:hypothetical protein [Phycisphaerales bacterium]